MLRVPHISGIHLDLIVTAEMRAPMWSHVYHGLGMMDRKKKIRGNFIVYGSSSDTAEPVDTRSALDDVQDSLISVHMTGSGTLLPRLSVWASMASVVAPRIHDNITRLGITTWSNIQAHALPYLLRCV